MRLPRTAATWRPIALAVVAMIGVTACAGGTTPRPSANGGVVTIAESPGAPPNYIFPLMSGSYFGNTNLFGFDNFMYPPLYQFDVYGKPGFDEALSIAKPPVFSDGNRVVSITLKHWAWSNGAPLTARDVIFWLNLLSAATDPKAPSVGSTSAPGPGWGNEVPGQFPQNVVSYRQTGTYSLLLNLNGSYNPTWFLYNELSQITPMPQSVWDKLSAQGTVGNYDASAQPRVALPGTSPGWYVPADPGTATSGALGVAQFLNLQSQDLASYATNQLWKVVDGPFALTQFTTSGFVKFVPNKSYSGYPKATIAALEELPYTSDSAEFNSLENGALTVGYLPTQDLAQRAALEAKDGYNFSPWYNYGTGFFPYNFTNQRTGPMVGQLYFRQAFQSLVNQRQWIRDFLGGYGFVDNGPVPLYPSGDPFLSPLEAGKPLYPYDPARAVALLRAHGWDVVPGGTSSCVRAGSGPADCGAGIAKGQSASLTLYYDSGVTALTNEMEALQSVTQKVAGIDLTLKQVSVASLASILFNGCSPKTPCNTWSMGVFTAAGGYSYSPDYLPTGGQLYATGAGTNPGDYSNATADRLIAATHTAPNYASELRDLFQYENFISENLPMVEQPAGLVQLTLYKRNLHGLVPQGIGNQFFPQFYRLG